MHFAHLPPESVVADRYKILSKIGQGANSCVYKALDLKTATYVAIKLLDPFLIHDPIAVERFERECQILRTLNYPNIIKVFDIHFEDSQKILIMEYFAGQDLKHFLKENNKIAWDKSLGLFRKIVNTLQECHAQGIVHRDIKPQNILINDNHDIKIVDFGVSKVSGMSDLTKTGTTIGTPEYMAPEMFLKSVLDFRTDVYSLGCILYEMLNGVPPFVSTQLSQLLSQKLNSEGIFTLNMNTEIPDWLQKICYKCLRVDPILRYQSCEELLNDLNEKEKALACVEFVKEKTLCLKCRTEMLPGFAFCYQCGTFQANLFTQGNSALIIHQCQDPIRLSQFLGRVFKDVGAVRFKKELKTLPFFLLQGVEVDTAQILANEMVYFRAQVQVAKTLEKEVKLPLLLVFSGIGLAVSVSAISHINLILKILLIGGLELGLFAGFKIYTRPLISKRSFQKRDSSISPEIKKYVQRIGLFKTSSSKAILGKLIQKMIGNDGSLESTEKVKPEILAQAFELAELIENYESHLAAQNLINIKTEIMRLEAKIKTSKELADIESLTQAKATLRNYYEIQDSYASARIKLLKLLTDTKIDPSIEMPTFTNVIIKRAS